MCIWIDLASPSLEKIGSRSRALQPLHILIFSSGRPRMAEGQVLRKKPSIKNNSPTHYTNQFSSAALSCLTLCDPMNCSTPGFPAHHQLLELNSTRVHQVSDAIQPSHPLSSPLLLPSIFPSIRVFSNESVLHIKWPKYWGFSYSISPSNEYSGLISFRIDFGLLAAQGTLKSLLQHHSSVNRYCKLPF